MVFLSDIWLTAVMIILRLRKIKNCITFKKNVSAIINTYL